MNQLVNFHLPKPDQFSVAVDTATASVNGYQQARSSVLTTVENPASRDG
jgi:hypothetical protein